MNKKNAIIYILILALGVSFYFVFQNKEYIKTENEIMNSSDVNIISPSQELRAAFDESSKRFATIVELSCFPSSRYDCSLERCTSAAPATYYFVDYGTESGTYFRCDVKGCDSYPVKVVPSGSYMQFIPLQGQAMLFKVAGDDQLVNKGEFVDIATLGTMTLVSFGKCEALK